MTAAPDPQLVRELSAEAHRRLFASTSEHIAAALTARGLTPDPNSALWAAIDEWLPRPLATPAELTAEQEEELRERWDASVTGRRYFAWHDLRVLSTPSLADDDEDHYVLGHANECAALPPGAVCWAVREPFRWWWPTAPGVYRIRPEDVPHDEDGVDWSVALHVQVRDEAGGWLDYDGDTAGAEPTHGEYDAIVERIKTATAEKVARQAAAQAERDDDLRALHSLAARFHGRIAGPEARTTDGGMS
jgi:hypothetical protein